MGFVTKRLMGAFAVVLLLLISMNMNVLSIITVYDLQEWVRDSLMAYFKIVPVNPLAHPRIHISHAGIGNRLIRDTSAYHLAKKQNLPQLKLEWGSCSQNTKRRKERSDKFSIFPYLFGNDVWNVTGTLSGSKKEKKTATLPVDGNDYMAGEYIKAYQIPLQPAVYKREDGPFFDKLQSDSEYYDRLVENYMFRDEVEAFMECHNFAEHEVLGIHLSAGNDEEKHKIEDQRQVMKNVLYLVYQHVRLMKMLYHDRFARRVPLIFLATDTPELIPEVQAETEKFGVKTVVLNQSRVEDNERVTYKALPEKACLEGWKATASEMMILSHSDVVFATRPSTFAQSLPLSRVFDRHVGEEGTHFCEVADDGMYMSCLEDKKTWLFRDNTRKVVPISRSHGIIGLFDPDFPQVVHRLLIELPFGKSSITGKYNNKLSDERSWNFVE